MIRILFLCLLALPAGAETLVAARTIPARTIIGPDDLLLRDIATTGGITDPSVLIGMEARVALYAGRPIRQGDVGPPAVVDRNQIIPLVYMRSGVMISTEGRALDRAGPGDLIRVMNLSSRSTVTARVGSDGAAYVSY
ncbi:flagellar basal body P-ring formation protein FlgA [Octadecabacter sp. SW4]|uniref:flagellar basal body P-ring formation chaperone FlgA n=1 Tax=Octadecabacter sp. SW4 TaxID=2602067 RepID=UPI0011C1DF59|nr:flagellar basal body P-ring formation chaperone FlgA [Octadecabacter sp. SW4]QEE37160.1 flagellar basal body P-ring formation protein FlgA [Octadecabacter sp. SW4]